MLSHLSAIHIWTVRIPCGELHCLTWEVGGKWRVRVVADQHEIYLQATAHDVEGVCRWATIIRRELERLGLGQQPAFDPDIDVTIDPTDSFDESVDECITCTDSRARRH
jgi:hypothetical protein